VDQRPLLDLLSLTRLLSGGSAVSSGESLNQASNSLEPVWQR
jgi:hypothetical protein